MNKHKNWLLAAILLIPFIITFVLSAESLSHAYQSGDSDLIRLWLCIYACQPVTIGLLYLLARGAVKIVKTLKG